MEQSEQTEHVEQASIVPSGPSVGKLLIGIVLLSVGVLAILDRFEFRDIGRYWPFVPILFGAGLEIDALRARKDSGGYIIIAFGVWLLGAARTFDYGFRTTFPIAVMVVGVGVVLHALVDRKPARKEKNHE